MKSHEWLLASTVGFVVLLLAIAIFSEDLWHDDDYEDAPPVMAGMMAPHRDGRERIACASCHVVLQPQNKPAVNNNNVPPGGKLRAVAPPSIRAGVRSPHRDGREQRVCSECHQILTADGRIAPNGAARQGLDAWSNMAPSLGVQSGGQWLNQAK